MHVRLTIGKDMVFRDYAQGAYRMRGIGRGQTIHLYIVPEIKRLIKKSLPRLTGNIEDDVAAWLQLNGMKAEKLQFLQLCQQNMSTVWRKVALDKLLASSGVVKSDSIPKGLQRFIGDTDGAKTLRTSIDSLKDLNDFDVPTVVPIAEPFSQSLTNLVQNNAMLCDTPEQKKIVDFVMKQFDDVMKSKDASESVGNEKKGLNSEMTREKEREQEQQKQKQQQQQVESMFARDKSRPYQWAQAS